jgi:hypothetical protein
LKFEAEGLEFSKILRSLEQLILTVNGWNQRENRLRESLQTFITLQKARAVYHWEVEADTKLYPDSYLGNSLCTSGCKPNLEKNLFFLASHAPRN